MKRKLRIYVPFPHNESMYKSRWFVVWALLLGLQSGTLVAAARSKPPKAAKPAALDSDYVAALSAADRFLEAWRIDDLEIGMSLLTSQVKEKTSESEVEKFFSSPAPSAYEIDRGKLLHRGSYEFPVVLVGPPTGSGIVHRRLASMVVVKTGNNEWAVDKLP